MQDFFVLKIFKGRLCSFINLDFLQFLYYICQNILFTKRLKKNFRVKRLNFYLHFYFFYYSFFYTAPMDDSSFLLHNPVISTMRPTQCKVRPQLFQHQLRRQNIGLFKNRLRLYEQKPSWSDSRAQQIDFTSQQYYNWCRLLTAENL